MFSASCQYALRAVVLISSASKRGGGFVSVDLIAEKIDVPRPFMLKILQHLVKNGIISSKKGPGGGFFMIEPNKTKRLSDVIQTIEGSGLRTNCVMGLKECMESNPCPLHSKFKSIRNEMIEMVEKHTIGDLGELINKGSAYLRL